MDSNIKILAKAATIHGESFIQDRSTNDNQIISATITKNGIALYVLFMKANDLYLATDVSSAALPREIYSDTPIQPASYKKRNDEILSYLKDLLSGKLRYYESPRLFNKKRGYIRMNIDGRATRIYQKRNYFDLPIANLEDVERNLPGKKIVYAMNKIADGGVEISKSPVKNGILYTIGDNDSSVKVRIEEKWLSLNFTIPKLDIEYFIDTDNYDITSEDNEKFLQTIETDIVDFLDNLGAGTLKVADGRSILVVPTQEGTDIVRPGRRSSYNKPLSELRVSKRYTFRPFGLHGHKTND